MVADLDDKLTKWYQMENGPGAGDSGQVVLTIGVGYPQRFKNYIGMSKFPLTVAERSKSLHLTTDFKREVLQYPPAAIRLVKEGWPRFFNLFECPFGFCRFFLRHLIG